MNNIDINTSEVINHKYRTNQPLILSEFCYLGWMITKLYSFDEFNPFIKYAIKNNLDKQQYIYKVWLEFYSIYLIDNKNE
jgi:hypothetical protein